MQALEAVRSKLNSGPVLQIIYGEPAARPIIETVLKESRIEPIERLDTSPVTVEVLAGVTHPILIQSFDEFCFDDLVTEDEMREYLRDHRDRPAPRILISFAGFGDHVGILYRFVKRIGDRPCRSLLIGKARKLYFAAIPGEHLVIATIGCAPVPDASSVI